MSHPHHKHKAMSQFNEGHWEKKPGDLGVSDLRYTDGEMSNPEHLMKANEGLVKYAKKHKMQYP